MDQINARMIKIRRIAGQHALGVCVIQLYLSMNTTREFGNAIISIQADCESWDENDIPSAYQPHKLQGTTQKAFTTSTVHL